MTFDISDTLAPKSDQLDAVDLLGSPPRTFTITKVSKGSTEQPVQVHLAEFPRPWRPGKTMRRVLAACWSNDASTWVGKRVELFCDETVVFGGEPVGGVRVKRLSHIDQPKAIPVIIKKGRGGNYKVEPLPDVAPAPTPSVDRLEKAISAFAGIGIDVDHLEARLSKPRSEWTADDLTTLLAYYKEAKKVADTEAVDQ